MNYIIIGLLVVILILVIISLAVKTKKTDSDQITDSIRKEIGIQFKDQQEDIATLVGALNRSSQESLSALGTMLKDSQTAAATTQEKQLKASNDSMIQSLDQFQKRIESFESSQKEDFERIRISMSDGMKDMRDENSKKLDEIKGTVDEKLQTTLERRISESFKTVSDQLEQVYKSMGEMQNLATDVGGLKKVLSGVKTRGILGEVQLGAILEEILAPEQYETNVATVPDSSERVEYAIKLPGSDSTVYLPIDSKFPGERYGQLLQAQESGNKDEIEAAYKNLETVIKQEADDIHSKYISVPSTTNFGIMFLPFEGLYAEVVNRGLVEVLQREYQVNICGPSTMAAYLNSLQMGFRTLAIQERSNEVWQVLGAVKTEFDNFEDVLASMQKHLRLTSDDLEKLSGTRTRAIKRKLREIETLDSNEAKAILELED